MEFGYSNLTREEAHLLLELVARQPLASVFDLFLKMKPQLENQLNQGSNNGRPDTGNSDQA